MHINLVFDLYCSLIGTLQHILLEFVLIAEQFFQCLLPLVVLTCEHSKCIGTELWSWRESTTSAGGDGGVTASGSECGKTQVAMLLQNGNKLFSYATASSSSLFRYLCRLYCIANN